MLVLPKMAPDANILIADDDAGHARLLMKNLQRSGLQNPIDRFENGQQVLDFLFCRGNRTRINKTAYMLLLECDASGCAGVTGMG